MSKSLKRYIFRVFTLILVLWLPVFSGSCDKRKPKFTQLKGETYNAQPVKAINLEGDYRVFIFMSPECPLSENYSRTINRLDTAYQARNVRFYLVFSGKFYPRPEIEDFLQKYRLPARMVIYDPGYRFRDYFEAEATPESFLTDIAGNIIYRGAIDNWAISLVKQRQVITEHYLIDAIESALSGQPVKIKKTDIVGCFIE